MTKAEVDLDCSTVTVVDSIVIDFDLVDYSVDVVEPMTYPTMMN